MSERRAIERADIRVQTNSSTLHRNTALEIFAGLLFQRKVLNPLTTRGAACQGRSRLSLVSEFFNLGLCADFLLSVDLGVAAGGCAGSQFLGRSA